MEYSRDLLAGIMEYGRSLLPGIMEYGSPHLNAMLGGAELMSSWRRRAAGSLPDHRRLIDRAESPTALWQQLYLIATTACAQPHVDVDLLRRLFEYARACRDSSSDDVTMAVQSEFYERLFDDARVRPHLPRLVSEPQFRALEPLFALRFTADQFVRMRADFYRMLAQVEAGTTLAELRRIKDELLKICPKEREVSLLRTWTTVLSILNAGEDLIGTEIFIDNLQEDAIPMTPRHESQLRDLLAQLSASVPRHDQ